MERFISADAARACNAWFLAIVAAWRVALLAQFLTHTSGLRWWATVVGTLLPIALIVVTLTTLNLEHVVYDIMSGIRPEDRSANDGAYEVVGAMGILSILATPILLIGYGVAVWRARRGA